MFIVEFSEKLRRSATRRNMEERAAAHRQELTERGKKALRDVLERMGFDNAQF